MNQIYLLLGSNEGERIENFQNSYTLISSKIGRILKNSSIYETAPWGNTQQAYFLNQVVLVESNLDPQKLLKEINVIELQLGRKRIVKWGSRIIDIDILFYNDEIVRYPDLIIPHKELHNRLFTLIPLQEIAPGMKHPVLNISVEEMIKRCTDCLPVVKLQTPETEV